MSVAAIIVAAGSGERLGAAVPKALVLLHGRPLLEWAAVVLSRHPSIASVVVVAPESEVAAVRHLLTGPQFEHPDGSPRSIAVVAGGATRQLSVRRGLHALPADADLVLIHDAARPLVPSGVIDGVIAALVAGAPAVIPVIDVVDTVKQVDADGVVVATVDRSSLRAVQTPQGFRRDVIEAAHAGSDPGAGGTTATTDDAGLVEAMGLPVRTVAGSELSMKITTPHDLMIAEVLAAGLAAGASVDVPVVGSR